MMTPEERKALRYAADAIYRNGSIDELAKLARKAADALDRALDPQQAEELGLVEEIEFDAEYRSIGEWHNYRAEAAEAKAARLRAALKTVGPIMAREIARGGGVFSDNNLRLVVSALAETEPEEKP